MALRRPIFVVIQKLERRRLLSASAVELPIGALSASNDDASSGDYQFVVTYNGSSSVNLSSLGNANIKVTGPGGFNQDATLAGVDANSSSINPPVFATYQIVPTGSAF